MPASEPAPDRGLWALSDPRLSKPAKMRNKCCYGQKNFGSICSCLSPSPTHLSHTTITFWRIKCERYIFIKKCVRSFIEVVIIVNYVSAYICICIYITFVMYYGYTTIMPQGFSSNSFSSSRVHFKSVSILQESQPMCLSLR